MSTVRRGRGDERPRGLVEGDAQGTPIYAVFTAPASSTTTTTPPGGSSTTTTLPTGCDMLSAYAAVRCRLETLMSLVGASDAGAFAPRLVERLAQASTAPDSP